MRNKGMLLVAAGFLLAPLAGAQQPQANVGRIYWSWARAGQAQQYEAGTKKHNEFHKMKKDPWTWYTWQVVSGNRGGQYISGTFWHEWKDFDNRTVSLAEDDVDYYKNVEPHEANWRGEHIVFMPDHSYPPESKDPAPLYELWSIQVKQGKVEGYLNAIKKIPEAAKKAGVNWRYNFWSVADGGTTTSFYASFPLKNWAERADQGSPFEEVLTTAYGRSEAHAIIRALEGSVEQQSSMVLVYRADLSYVPTP